VLNAPTLNVDPSGENIFTGVMGGATVGSLGGPIGTVAGGIVGGLLGLVAGQLLWDNVVEPLLPKGLDTSMAAEHTKNKRKGNWNKHSKRRPGEWEKGDVTRRPPRNRPDDYPRKGPWPPSQEDWIKWCTKRR
jgi:hypothetical protein